MKTKEKILVYALRMFNEQGAEKISTRHIATEMNISVGNLHYHYPNKNEVILQLMKAFLKRTDALAILLEQEPPGPHNWTAVIELTFELIVEYRFLFNDRLVLTRRLPEIQNMFREMVVRRRVEFMGFVGKLTEEGLLRTDLPGDQYEALFKQIVILYNSWLGHHILFDEEHIPMADLPGYYAGIISRIWTPYFSAKGRSVFLGES